MSDSTSSLISPPTSSLPPDLGLTKVGGLETAKQPPSNLSNAVEDGEVMNILVVVIVVGDDDDESGVARTGNDKDEPITFLSFREGVRIGVGVGIGVDVGCL